MENKTSKNFLLAIMGVLILVELFLGLMSIGKGDLLVDSIKLIPLVFVALYGFWLYKKPHGNMLKYAMLLLAILQIFSAITCIQKGWNPYNCAIIRIFAATIIVYVSGRLNRIEQNKYLLPIAAVMHFVSIFLNLIVVGDIFTPIYLLTWFCGTITIVTLMIAYFVRYKEHKEAGLMDAPKE